MKADIQQFIGLLFASRDYAHKAHLNTDSFAAHMALGDFYDGIIDLADSLAETWMGRNLTKVGWCYCLRNWFSCWLARKNRQNASRNVAVKR